MFWRPSVKLSPLRKTNLGKYCQNSAQCLPLIMYFVGPTPPVRVLVLCVIFVFVQPKNNYYD